MTHLYESLLSLLHCFGRLDLRSLCFPAFLAHGTALSPEALCSSAHHVATQNTTDAAKGPHGPARAHPRALAEDPNRSLVRENLQAVQVYLWAGHHPL